MALQISSPVFANGQHIPVRYTCDGQDISPPLEWGKVLYDIAPSASSLNEGVTGIGRTGRNSFKHIGYNGPCPPHGDRPHRYVFNLFAVDIATIGRDGLTRDEVISAIGGHVLAEGQLLARYQRAKVSSRVSVR